MRVVLDTNVLVTGLLSPYGPCAQIARMVSSGALILCLDSRILWEYHEVLRRPKFLFEADAVSSLLDYIEHSGEVVASPPLSSPLLDPDDQPFLEATVAGGAECLVTGNRAHFPARRRHRAKVLSPADFLALYRRKKR